MTETLRFKGKQGLELSEAEDSVCSFQSVERNRLCTRNCSQYLEADFQKTKTRDISSSPHATENESTDCYRTICPPCGISCILCWNKLCMPRAEQSIGWIETLKAGLEPYGALHGPRPLFVGAQIPLHVSKTFPAHQATTARVKTFQAFRQDHP